MKKLTVLLASLIIAMSFSACGSSTNNTATENSTTQVVETTETTAATETTVQVTQAATEEATTEAIATEAAFTEDDAIEMVKKKFPGDEYGFLSEGVKEVDGEEYYAVRLSHRVDGHYSTLTIYFVKTDGSEMIEGYFNNDGTVEFFD